MISARPPEGVAGLLLTVRQAAALLGQPERKVYRWAAEGRLPGVRRLGRALYIARPELEDWLAVNGPEPPGTREERHVGPAG